jgi:O-antigen ligase
VALGLAMAPLPFPGPVAVALAVPAVGLAVSAPRVALTLLVFLIPFSSWTKVSFGPYDVTAADVLVALILVTWLVRGVARGSIVLHAGVPIAAGFLLLGSAVLSTLTALDFPGAVKEVAKLAEMLTVALYVASTATRLGDIRFLMLAMVAAGAAEAAVGLWQFATGSGPETFAIGPFMRAYGNFAQPNALAGYLGLVLPFGVVLIGRRDPLWLVAAGATAVIFMGILASLSRGAWLGIALGLSAMALTWSEATRRALAGGVGLGFALLLLARSGMLPGALVDRLAVLLENLWIFDVRAVELTPANWALVERMAHWQAGWAMAMDHPWVGVGPGNYEAYYPQYFLRGWTEPLGHAHNYYINTFAEMGLLGVAALIGFLTSIFTRLLAGLLEPPTPNPQPPTPDAALLRATLVACLGAVVTVCAHNVFDNMFVHGIGVQFGLIIGLIEAVSHQPPAVSGRQLTAESSGVLRAHRD